LPPERPQAAELNNWFRLVVYAKVTDAIDAFSGSLRRSVLLDDERSRLLPRRSPPAA
jgi:hypothetical protein